MSHPFDDMDLTFGDLKKIIKGALTGNLELTREQQMVLGMAITSRVITIKKLIEGWKSHPDEHSEELIEAYSKELETLKSIQI
jgi:hypothetical protein